MELNYKVFGQGDPVIILHGLFGTLDNWQTLAKKMAEHFTVFILDQRNHGRSPHLPDINYEVMAEDLREFMEQKWIHQAHIIGHSMGGKTAMHFALHHDDLVDKLVVVDIGPQVYIGNHDIIFNAMLGLDLKKLTSRKEAENQLAEKITSDAVRLFLLKNLTRNKTGSYEWKLNLPVIYKNYKNILSRIQGDFPFEGETLFVRGEKSDYLEENDMKNIHTLFPNATMTSLDAGHWIHAEVPDDFLKAVLNFLL